MGSTPPSDQPLDRARQIAAVGKQLLDREGPEGLSMRRLADQIGLTAPALYRYYPDKHRLEDAIRTEAHWELGDLAEAATNRARAEGTDPLLALVASYRSWALAHPHLYRLVYCAPIDRNRYDPAAEERGAELLREIVGYDLRASAGLWTFVHGLVMLELDQRMTEHMDPPALLAYGVERLRP